MKLLRVLTVSGLLLGAGLRADEPPAAPAQPAATPAAPADATPAKDAVIYPRSSAKSGAPATTDSAGAMFNAFTLVAAIIAGAGGWWMWRRQKLNGPTVTAAGRKLTIAETRSLGNRQYLVVADYDGKKFLLGVCPGRIDLLSPLDDKPTPPPSP